MDVTDLVEAVREANNTELSRLGSSKSLYADTEGEMDSPAVLTAVADSAYHLAETADGWANDGDGYGDVYETVAAVERDHYDTVVAELDAHEPGDRPPALEVLRGFDAPLERLGGLVGWTLVAEEKAGQATGFFTGQADPQTASLFREFGTEYESLRGDLIGALDAAGEDEADFDAARAAADQVVGAAYDDYFETLEELGVNPKPVC